MKFTLYTADCTGNAKNTLYPNQKVITSETDLKKAVAFDHVCALYENFTRRDENFRLSDVVPMDCDNDHSDEPDEWITPKKLGEMLSDVAYAVTYSRHHMLAKGSVTARPRFYVFFPTFFMSGISIPQWQCNKTMSHYASRILKRLGVTDKAYKKFPEKAQDCEPPLEQEELDKIWASACKFYRKVASSPDYIPPDEYTGDSLKPDDFSDIGEARTFAAVYEGEVCYTEATGFLRNNEIYWMESRQRPIAAMMEHTDVQLEEAGGLIESTLDTLEDLGISRGAAMAGGKKLLESMNSEQAAAYSEYVNAKSYYAFVMKCRNMKGLKAAMEAAMPLLEKQPDELDSNPFLLNTPTATYNLTEGLAGTKEHDPEDYITKVTTVSPDDVGADIWQDTLDLIFCGDKDLIDYVHVYGKIEMQKKGSKSA